MKNKILIVGVLDVEGSTNIYMKKGFEKLGYEVDAYNYRTVMKSMGMNKMWLNFQNSIIGTNYDLIVFCKTNQMHPMLISQASEVAPTWYWFMDNIEVARATHASTYAQNATVASATSSDVADRFRMVNKNSHHIFEGYDPDVYFYQELKKIHDVTFIGNATIPRIIEINNIRKKGVNVTIFGSGWPYGMKPNSPVFAEEERWQMNQSRIVLNLCHNDVIFSDRVVKALGCGAVVFSQPCKDLLDSEIGDSVFMYDVVDTLYAVQVDNNPELVAKTAALNYSWEARCKTMLAKVNNGH